MEDAKKILDEHSIDPIRYLLEILPRLQPNQQATIMLALLPYKYPKIKEVEEKRNGDGSNPALDLKPDDLLQLLQESSSNNGNADKRAN